MVLKGAASEQRQTRNSQLDYISAAQQATQGSPNASYRGCNACCPEFSE